MVVVLLMMGRQFAGSGIGVQIVAPVSKGKIMMGRRVRESDAKRQKAPRGAQLSSPIPLVE